MGSTKLSDTFKLIVSIVACQCAGLVGSIFAVSAIPIWFAALQKPSFAPPDWLFAPAWITLYLLMGISAFFVWRRGLDNREVKAALIIFLMLLLLNALWSAAFFGLESPLYGLMVTVALWIAILFTIIKFFRISSVAGWILVPYILWVSFATALNISILILNS